MGVPVVAVVAAWMITVVAGDIVGGARRIVDVPPLTDPSHGLEARGLLLRDGASVDRGDRVDDDRNVGR